MKPVLSLGLVAITAGLALAGCGQSGSAPQAPGAPTPAGPAGGVSGAGATFPAPLYTKWAEAYRAQGGVAVNYQPIGSGGGVKQIEARTVDFGASDKPLRPEDLQANGLVQFPTVMGGVTPILNAPGIQAGQLKLSGAVLADIYLGTVKRWNDPAIAGLNAGLALPNLPITVVHRSDGSGTSFLFTSYLSLASPTWMQKVGGSDAVEWPTGVGGKGNDGVSALVKQTVGAIGYVEYAYAKQNSLAFAQLQSKGGGFVSPTAEAFAAAASGADWAHAPGNYLLLLNQPGVGAWPITGATFILMHKAQADAAKAKAVLGFVDWAYKSGDKDAQALDYVPLPETVKTLVRGQWSAIVGPDGKPVYAPTR